MQFRKDKRLLVDIITSLFVYYIFPPLLELIMPFMKKLVQFPLTDTNHLTWSSFSNRQFWKQLAASEKGENTMEHNQGSESPSKPDTRIDTDTKKIQILFRYSIPIVSNNTTKGGGV